MTFYFQYQVFKRGKYNRFTAPYYRDPYTHYLEGRVELHIVCRNAPMQGCILKHGYCKLSLDSLRRGESILRGVQLRCDTHGALVLLLLLQNTGIEQLKEESNCFVPELWVSVYHGEKGAAVDPQCDWSHCTQTGSREMNSYTQLSFCFSFSLLFSLQLWHPILEWVSYTSTQKCIS